MKCKETAHICSFVKPKLMMTNIHTAQIRKGNKNLERP